jgi:hypothetical protein
MWVAPWRVGRPNSPIEKRGARVIPFSHQQGILADADAQGHFLDDPDPAEYAIVATPATSRSTTAAPGTASRARPWKATRASAASCTCR